MNEALNREIDELTQRLRVLSLAKMNASAQRAQKRLETLTAKRNRLIKQQKELNNGQ